MTTAVTSPSGENFLVGNGDIYFAELFTTGLPKGERHIGNCTQFAQTVAPTKLTKRSRMDSARGILKSINLSNEITIAISMDEATVENLAIHSLGTILDHNQSSGSITDEDISDPDWKFNLWYKLTKSALTAVVVEHITAGPVDTALTVNTDYVMDLVEGRIKMLSTGPGTVVEGETLKITATVGAITGRKKIAVGTEAAVERYVRFVGDPTTGPTYDAEYWKVDFAPNGELSLIQDEWGAWVLTGTVLADTVNHPTEPFARICERS